MACANEAMELELPVIWQRKQDARERSLKYSSANVDRDDWDFMEFSEIAQILKNEKVEVDVTEPFLKPVHQTSLPAGQSMSKSGPRSEFPVEDSKSFSTQPQESFGVNQQISDLPTRNSVESTNVNHSHLMEVSSSRRNLSEKKFAGTLVQSSQGWLVWTSTPQPTQAQTAENFVQCEDLKQSTPNSTSSTKLKKENIGTSGRFVQFLTDSMAEKPSLFPTSLESTFSGNVPQGSDENQLVQCLTILPSSSDRERNLLHGDMLHEWSDMRHSRQQYPMSFPSTSYASEAKRAAGTAGSYVQLLNLNQSMMQSRTMLPFSPSSRGEWEIPLKAHSFHEVEPTVNRTFVQCTDTMDSSSPFLLSSTRKTNFVLSDHISSPVFGQSSNLNQVMAQNQTPSYIPFVNKGFLIGNENLSGLPNMKFVPPANANILMEDAVVTTPHVQGEPKNSIKCRTRSKPGCSTNPRSLTEKTRRQRINEKFKELQELIPNPVKGDNIVDMLDQAISYVAHLEKQLQVLIMEKSGQRDIDLSSLFQGNDDEREQANVGTLKRRKCRGEGKAS